MKIYLDNCCFNRPFDDQTQPRIRLETEAIKTILKLQEQKFLNIIISQITLFESQNTPDLNRRLKLCDMIYSSQPIISLTSKIVQRAKYFESCNVDAMDAMHLACAENNADVFLTVDHKFLKRAELIANLEIEVTNPLTWLQKISQ